MGWARLLPAAALALASPLSGSQDHWLLVQSSHFSVFTPGSQRDAEKWAITLEQFCQGLDAGLPHAGGAPPSVPVVLFRRDRDFQAYKPLENGKPAKLGGFFLRTGDINVIALSLEHQEAGMRHTIQHEAVHWYFSLQDQSRPLWLKEGIAEAYSTFRVADPHIGVFGDPIAEHVILLKRRGLMPLGQLLRATHDSIHYNELTRTGIFYAESWLFLHYLIFGPEGHSGERMDRYEASIRQGATPEQAVRRAFGMDLADLQSRLQGYLASGAFRFVKVPLDDRKINRSLHAGLAREGEVEMALGSILAGTRERPAAESRLRRAASLLPDDPRPWECLGNMALRFGDMPGAAGFYAKAASLGSKNFTVYFNFALVRLGIDPASLRAVPTGVTGDLLPSLNALRQAIALNPSYLPSYRAFAWIMANSRAASPQDIEILRQGVSQAPGDSLIAAGLGVAEIVSGDSEDGRRRLQAIASATGGLAGFARAILQVDDQRRLERTLHRLFAEHRYGEVGPAIAAFEASDPERASAVWDRLEKIRRQAAAAMASPNPPAAR